MFDDFAGQRVCGEVVGLGRRIICYVGNSVSPRLLDFWPLPKKTSTPRGTCHLTPPNCRNHVDTSEGAMLLGGSIPVVPEVCGLEILCFARYSMVVDTAFDKQRAPLDFEEQNCLWVFEFGPNSGAVLNSGAASF